MENAAGHLDVLLAALGDETDAYDHLATRGACAAPLAMNHELEALRRWNESSARAALVADDAMTLPVVLAMNAATLDEISEGRFILGIVAICLALAGEAGMYIVEDNILFTCYHVSHTFIMKDVRTVFV